MKVGDYVRTKYGITQIKENVCLLDEVIKSSPNIIDLIEVGDICTFEVVDIDNYEDYIGKHTEVINQDELEDFKDMIQNESAKLISIVTKEQFESMEYKI